MKFQQHSVSELLSPYIQGYLEADCRDCQQQGKYPLFPNGLSGIFFNFGSRGKLILRESHETHAISIFGQIDQCFMALHEPRFYSLGVLFKPTALSKLLQIDMAELTNTTADGTLLRADFKLLHEKLQDTRTIQQKIELLNTYFTNLLKVIPSQKTISDYALELIHRNESLSVEQVSKHLKISQRYLEMDFKKTVGISPKTYSLIQRFMRVEQQLSQFATPQWQQLKFRDEYHDQNHFIKDFKRFYWTHPF